MAAVLSGFGVGGGQALGGQKMQLSEFLRSLQCRVVFTSEGGNGGLGGGA